MADRLVKNRKRPTKYREPVYNLKSANAGNKGLPAAAWRRGNETLRSLKPSYFFNGLPSITRYLLALQNLSGLITTRFFTWSFFSPVSILYESVGCDVMIFTPLQFTGMAVVCV